MSDEPRDVGGQPPGKSSSSHDAFYEYYAHASLSEAAYRRFLGQRDTLLALLEPPAGKPLEVLDLGCGAGTSTMIWADAGHRPVGLDINEKLIALAARRAREREVDARFLLGSAGQLPFPDDRFDVCVAPELLEHVPDWRECLDEIARTLKPGGIVFLSTTNVLCPVQDEFNLPLFSWYPGPIKRHYIRQAQTTRPELANYATFPAVNWFTFYSLRRALRQRGFDRFRDRFDVLSLRSGSALKARVARAIASTPATRFGGQVVSPGTKIYALKESR